MQERFEADQKPGRGPGGARVPGASFHVNQASHLNPSRRLLLDARHPSHRAGAPLSHRARSSTRATLGSARDCGRRLRSAQHACVSSNSGGSLATQGHVLSARFVSVRDLMEPVATLSEELPGQPIVDSLYARRPAAALLAVGSIGAAALCFVTGENLIVGLLPQVSAALHTSLSATGLLVTFYAIVVVLVSVPLTRLTRTITRRWLLSGLLAMFVLGTLGVVLAPSYGWVLAARIVVALAQALFWSIAPVTAAGLFSPQARARAVAGIYVGTSGAVIVGIPAGTWIGQQFGWRVPFLALAGVGLLCLIGTLALLPTSKPSESHAAAGSAPDARRYRVIVITTALAVAAFFVVFTYISPFLTRVSGLPSHAVAPMLLVGGVGGTLGIAGLGAFFQRHPTAATILPVALLMVSLSCFFAFGKARS